MIKSLKKAIAFSLTLGLILTTTCPVFAEKPTYITNDTYYRNNMDYYEGAGIGKYERSDTLELIDHFDTYLQKQSYTCGCVAAMMVENYYTGCGMDEDKVEEMMNAMGSTADYGTDTVSMKKYFDDMGWQTEVNYIEDEDHIAPNEGLNPKVDGAEKPYEALEFLKNNVVNGIPTIVEWVDWGGHWQVVVGYDDNGTSDFSSKADIRDDVIIMADPADKTDHNWDGYYAVPAARFLYMWYDDYCLLRNPNSDKYNVDIFDYLINNYVCHPFLIATPPEVMANVEGAAGTSIMLTEEELSAGVTIRLSLPLHLGGEFKHDNIDISAFTLNDAPAGTIITNLYDIEDDTVAFTIDCDDDFDEDYEMTISVEADAVMSENALTSNIIRIKAALEP